MKLYYAPDACSLASHIALVECGLSFEIERVDLQKKRTESGRDFDKINLKGSVPALEIDGGDVLTESLSVLMWIGDRRPNSRLVPHFGTIQRYRVEEWLAYLTTEVHKAYGARAFDKVGERLAFVEAHMEERRFLVAETFTVADAYLYVMERWAPGKGVLLGQSLRAHLERVDARPAVRAALGSEGLALARVA